MSQPLISATHLFLSPSDLKQCISTTIDTSDCNEFYTGTILLSDNMLIIINLKSPLSCWSFNGPEPGGLESTIRK